MCYFSPFSLTCAFGTLLNSAVSNLLEVSGGLHELSLVVHDGVNLVPLYGVARQLHGARLSGQQIVVGIL